MAEVKFPKTVQEILDNPSQFGVPTFDQFAKNPDVYRTGHEQLLETVDVGSKLLGGYINKYIYEICGYRCRTLEEVQQVGLNEGMDFRAMEISTHIIPETSYNGQILVRFKEKHGKR